MSRWLPVDDDLFLMKRAGETSDTPAQAPVQPPSNNVPKIGGTFGGFIALIVCLATIVVFACIGIFILLLKHKPDPYERHYRQAMFGKRENGVYEAPLGPQGMRAKFKHFFGGGKKSEGWMRTGNGSEEWNASDHHLVGGQTTRGMAASDAAHVPSARRSSTAESIELSVPSGPTTAAGAALDQTVTYADPFRPVVSPTASSDSGNSDRHIPEEDGRFSVPSGVGTTHSMRKFDGGTKFKEAIDFQ